MLKSNIDCIRLLKDEEGRVLISLEDLEELACLVAMDFTDSLDGVTTREREEFLEILQTYAYMLLGVLYPERSLELSEALEDENGVPLYS